MVEIRTTELFLKWFRSLRDIWAQARIQTRIDRLQLGLVGDAKFFDGIGELRIDYGPGYRVYFAQHGQQIVILLCAGDKGTQAKDIRLAKNLLKELRDEP